MPGRSFKLLLEEVRGLPATWYPAFLKCLVQGATKTNVYLPGALQREVGEWIAECEREPEPETMESLRQQIRRLQAEAHYCEQCSAGPGEPCSVVEGSVMTSLSVHQARLQK